MQALSTKLRYLGVLLSVFCSLHLALLPALSANESINGKPPPDPAITELARTLAQNDLSESPADRNARAALEEIADASEKNLPLNPKHFDLDPNKLLNQRVEIPKAGLSYPVGDPHLQNFNLRISSITVKTDAQKGELIFEGRIGADERAGVPGEVVARHVIGNLDILKTADDAEFAAFISKTGSLSLVDMGVVATSIFNSEIPVLPYAWVPLKPLSLEAGQVEVEFQTEGSRPVNARSFEDAVLPEETKKTGRYRAGDLRVVANNSLIGIFDRTVLHDYAARGLEFMMVKNILAVPDPERMQLFDQVIDQLKEDDRDIETYLREVDQMANAPGTLTPELKAIYNQTSIPFLKTLHERSKRNLYLKSRNRDLYSLEENERFYDSIAARIQAQVDKGVSPNPVPPASKWKEFIVQKKTLGAPDPLAARTKSESKVKKILGRVTTPLSRFFSKLKIPTNVAHALLTASPAIILASAAPIYETYLAGLHIQQLDAFYRYVIPDVLRDAMYRNANVNSMVALVGIWPAAVGMSYAFHRGLNTIYQRTAHLKGPMYDQIRELQKNWQPLSTWQTITTFGMRVFARFVYPMARRILIEAPNAVATHIFRQPDFFPALEEGKNPFRKVDPNSAVGKAAGLEAPARIGVNAPTLDSKKQASVSDVKARIRQIEDEQKKSIESLSWLLATLTVSQESGVDPATLQLVVSGQVSPETIARISDDPKLFQQWEIAARHIQVEISKNDLLSNPAGLTEISEEHLRASFAIMEEAAQKIKSMSGTSRALSQGAARFKKFCVQSANWLLNFGRTDAEFFKKIYMPQTQANMAEREFVPDHLYVVLIYALLGDRAILPTGGYAATTAAQRRDLAADPNGFMWTSSAHFSDVVNNTYIHFFRGAASRALVYYQAPSRDEFNYTPIEHLLYEPKERRQGFLSSLADDIKTLGKPRELDLGGIVVRENLSYWRSVQANILQNMGFRCWLGGQTIQDALLGWLYGNVWGYWFFAWPWTLIGSFNNSQGERFDNYEARLKEAQALISQGIRTQNVELAQKGEEQLLELYRAQNPEALASLARTLDPNAKVQNLNRFSVKELKIFELMGALIQARHEGRVSDADSLQASLSEALKTGDITTDAKIRELGQRALLDLSVSQSPIYTAKNENANWFWAQAGAISTTYMSIKLAANTFRPEYLTWTNVGLGAVYSHLGYAAAWFLFSRYAWSNWYVPAFEKYKSSQGGKDLQKLGQTLNQGYRSVVPEKGPQLQMQVTGTSCTQSLK